MSVRPLVLAFAIGSVGCGVLLGLEDKRPFPDANEAGAVDGASTDAARDGGADGLPNGCQRDCVGGACNADGTCGVVTLFDTGRDAGDAEVEHPLAVAVLGDVVFWSTSRGNIHRCNRRSCASTHAPVALTSKIADAGYSDENEVFSLAADATHVYWAQYYGQKIFRAPHDGGPVEVHDARGYPNAIAVDDQTFYWINFGAGTSSLWRIPKANVGASGGEVFMSDPYVSQTQPAAECTEAQQRCWYGMSLALNGTNLVFVDAKPYPRGEIMSIPKGAVDASVATAGHGGFPGPSSVVAFDEVVYFTQYGFLDDAGTPVQGELVKLQPSQVPQSLVNNQSKPESIATDGIDLFWFAAGAGAIRKCAIGGCDFKPATLATNQRAATSLVASGNALYWANGSGTEVNMIVVR